MIYYSCLLTYISSVDNAVVPTANACCLPSAITAYSYSQVNNNFSFQNTLKQIKIY